MSETKIDNSQKEDVFDFLENLRDSGVTNMFGAPPYLQREFGFQEAESRAWLSVWMKSFSK